MAADLAEAGDEDLIRKLSEDFKAAGVQQSEHQIRRTMEEFLASAVEDIKAGR